MTSEELERFDAAFDRVRVEVTSRPEDGGRSAPHIDPATRTLEAARADRRALRLEAAWTALKAADRELPATRRRSQLVAEAQLVHREARRS